MRINIVSDIHESILNKCVLNRNCFYRGSKHEDLMIKIKKKL